MADDQAHRPLIYPILYKSVVFALLLIIFHVLEEVLKEMWHGKAVVDSIGAQGLEQTIVLYVIMFVVLMPFFALREIGRDVGDDKLFEQFFLRRSRYVPLQFEREVRSLNGDLRSKAPAPDDKLESGRISLFGRMTLRGPSLT